MLRFISAPHRLMPLGFLGLIVLGACLLKLPWSTAPGQHTSWLTAFFTATSASCVTGLIVVDTPTHYSLFGQGVILFLIQMGGLGIITAATGLAIAITGKTRLRDAQRLSVESKNSNFGDTSRLPLRIIRIVLATEFVIAVVLTLRFKFAYDSEWPRAIWHGVFHAISAFNNAGFATYSDNIASFIDDPVITLTLCVAVIAGGLGYPFFFQMRHVGWQWRKWSFHVRITLLGTLILLVGGALAIGAMEWGNPGTLGNRDWPTKIIGVISMSVMPRTAGFASIDYTAATEETLLLTSILMFIGGGSAGTAGGIKVTTFFLLAFVIWSEVRGYRDTNLWNRRLSTSIQRQALTIALLGVAAVVVGTSILLVTTNARLDYVLFEAASAFGTAGLSANLTPTLPPVALVTLIAMMFVGRVGTVVVAASLALNRKPRHYRYPTDQPLIG